MQNFNYNPYNYMPQANNYYFVDGIEAAKAFQCKPNSMTLLMDSQQPICYKKQVDMYGKTIALEVYDLVPHQEQPPVQYATKQELEELKTLIKGMSDNA